MIRPKNAVRSMTSPSWVVEIAGPPTDSGGALSHPAVASRGVGIPAVVDTRVATQKDKTGQRVRVSGAAGLVEILEVEQAVWASL